MQTLAATLAGVALLFAGVGCASLAGSSSTELEEIIEQQLPNQLRKVTGYEGSVRSVTCVETGEGNRFDCVARVSLFGFAGVDQNRSVSITGYCDDRSCTWSSY